MKRLFMTVLSMLLLLSICLLPVGGTAFVISTPGPTSAGATEKPVDSSVDGGTPTSSATPSPTPLPLDPNARYGITNNKGVNVRETADAKSDILLQIKESGSVAFIILEDEKVSDTETWFKVEVGEGEDAITGYIRNDLVVELTPEGYAAALLAIEEANKVWVTDTGKRYHIESTCSGMQNAYQLTLTDAKSRGYVPCANCDAPK